MTAIFLLRQYGITNFAIFAYTTKVEIIKVSFIPYLMHTQILQCSAADVTYSGWAATTTTHEACVCFGFHNDMLFSLEILSIEDLAQRFSMIDGGG